ncbi:MAG: hypothetical protein ACI93T_003941, partial [Porticoccaceae bacterium]
FGRMLRHIECLAAAIMLLILQSGNSCGADAPLRRAIAHVPASIDFLVPVGDRRAKRTHFGKLIGVENGPTVVVSGDFESFRFRALGVKDAYGGRLRTDQACSS